MKKEIVLAFIAESVSFKKNKEKEKANSAPSLFIFCLKHYHMFTYKYCFFHVCLFIFSGCLTIFADLTSLLITPSILPAYIFLQFRNHCICKQFLKGSITCYLTTTLFSLLRRDYKMICLQTWSSFLIHLICSSACLTHHK